MTITDQKGCFKDTSVIVLEPDALLIASMSMDSASCNGVADGTATANGITGGNGINSFSWEYNSGTDYESSYRIGCWELYSNGDGSEGMFYNERHYGIRARCIIDCFYIWTVLVVTGLQMVQLLLMVLLVEME